MKITIGRGPDNDIVYDIPMISTKHAELLINSNGTIILKDISSNGTWINGRLLHHDSCVVRQGDNVLFPGNVILDWSMVNYLYFKSQSTDNNVSHSNYAPSHNQPQPKLQEMPDVSRNNYAPSYNANAESYNHNNNYNQANPSESYRNTIKQPVRMSFGKAISSIFHKYATFKGRARRSEYWYFVLFNFLLSIVPIINIIWFFVAIIPGLSVFVRRMHDIGRSGWCYLFILIPIVGHILLLVWLCQDSEPDRNEYGDNPKFA